MKPQKNLDSNPMRDAMAFAQKVFDRPEAFPPSFIALPMDSHLIQKILSAQRMKLIKYLREHGTAQSVRELAAALQRKEPAVSRDLHLLLEIGLVEKKRDGVRVGIRATGRPILIQ